MNPEIKEYILSCRDNRRQAAAFFKTLGITPETVEEYKLGYDPTLDQGIIPGSSEYDYFLQIDKEGKILNFVKEEGSDRIFFDDNLNQGIPCFIVDSPIDALAIIQEGKGECTAFPIGKKGIESFKDLFLKYNPSCQFVTWLKNPIDEARVMDFFRNTEKDNQRHSMHENQSTPGQLLTSDPGTLFEKIRSGIEEANRKKEKKPEEKKKSFRSVNVSEYLGSAFTEDIEYFRKYKNRKTGFQNIDKYLTLYPGLACLTGATSLGKTSFCVQLADQLIDKGESVIYFSLEQLPIEIVTKSLARGYYLLGGFNLKNNDIKEGAFDDRLNATKAEYRKKADKFEIVSSDFNMTVDQIIKYVTDYIERTGVKPIVFVDYLQIIAAPEDNPKIDDRSRIDDAIKKLKKLSREKELFILAISSMARNSYREKLDEAAFKSTGLIEYSCDYLFGLQLSILEEDEFFQKTGSRGGTKETLASEKQDKIDEASEAMPKEVVFKAMKNRNGRKTFKAFFKYRPDYDLFEEDPDSKYGKKRILQPKKDEPKAATEKKLSPSEHYQKYGTLNNYNQ